MAGSSEKYLPVTFSKKRIVSNVSKLKGRDEIKRFYGCLCPVSKNLFIKNEKSASALRNIGFGELGAKGTSLDTKGTTFEDIFTGTDKLEQLNYIIYVNCRETETSERGSTFSVDESSVTNLEVRRQVDQIKTPDADISDMPTAKRACYCSHNLEGVSEEDYHQAPPLKENVSSLSLQEADHFIVPSTIDKYQRRYLAEKHVHPESVLVLQREEAFYLHLQGLLTVESCTDSKELTTDDLWKTFVEMDADFPSLYTAFSYLRQNNWLPRRGLTFGVDYIVYREGPEVYHSSYCVKVRTSHSSLSWLDVIAMQRVAENAGKQLLVLDVLQPVSGDFPLSSESIQGGRVQETLVKRWHSGKDRARQES